MAINSILSGTLSPTNNHSQAPDYEPIHGNVLRFNTDTMRCPFPTAFLWHECRVRGFHPTCGDRPVNPKRPTSGLRGGGFSGGLDGAGAHDDSPGGHDGGGDYGNGGSGAGGQVDGPDTNVSGNDDTKTSSFTPTLMRLDGDEFATWLKAAKQHSSWRDCVMENTSWSGTAEENIEKYQHEVLPQLPCAISSGVTHDQGRPVRVAVFMRF